MINETIQNHLLEQLRVEWQSEFAYLGMMAWCYNNDWDGFGAWFLRQSVEEREHGMKILRFISETGGKMLIPAIDAPTITFSSIQECYEQALHHEEMVTHKVHDLMDAAIKSNDHSTQTFLQWFIQEQVEEEATARHILAKVRRAKDHPAALLMIEQQLGNPDMPGVPAPGGAE